MCSWLFAWFWYAGSLQPHAHAIYAVTSLAKAWHSTVLCREHCKANSEESKVFNDAMTMGGSMGAGPCAQAYDFGRHSSVVDIGGGHGKLLSTVLDKYPGEWRYVRIPCRQLTATKDAICMHCIWWL